MKENGQVTIEFIIAIGVLFFIFAFALFAYDEKNIGFIHSKESFNAGVLAEKLAQGINTVFLAGDGAETTVLLAGKGDFNVSVSGKSVWVAFRGQRADSRILTGNVSVDSLSIGGRVNVRNISGGIFIENA